MTTMCKLESWPLPDEFRLNPLDCKAALAHWRTLSVFLAELTPDQRAEFCRLDAWEAPTDGDGEAQQSNESEEDPDNILELAVMDVVGYEDIPSPPPPVLTSPALPVSPRRSPIRRRLLPTTTSAASATTTASDAIDAHFHLDRLSRRISGRGLLPLARLGSDLCTGVQPSLPVTLVGGISVFCDPVTYPEQFPCASGFKCAVGFHPRHAPAFTPGIATHLEALLHAPGVAALGEIGLDHTEPECDWEKQEEVFTELLMFSMPVMPVVLHVRDRDPYASDLYLRCLKILKANVAPTQRVHLHSFAGTPDQVTNWLETFSHTYFSFSGLSRHFDRRQIDALKRVPADHLLLETDSPYLRPLSSGTNTPAYLGDVATIVSGHRECSVEWLLSHTVANARRLYRL